MYTCRVSARIDGGNASTVVAHLRGHTILLPYVRQEIDEKVWDATSPYGYGGAVWTPGCAPDPQKDLLGTIFGILAAEDLYDRLLTRGRRG
jgi:hypothetical protein